MNAVLDYTFGSLLWSMVGFGIGVSTTLLYLTTRRGRESKLGRWLLADRKAPEMDDRLKRDKDFPYRPWRRFLGPIILLLAVGSVASMAYDANQRNEQTRCLAIFVEDVTTNLAQLRALAAQDRQLLDQTFEKIVAQSNSQVYRRLLDRLRAGESAESVLTDLFAAAAKDQSGVGLIREYLAERKRIDAERNEHPLPQVTNCIDPSDLPEPTSPPSTIPSTLPSPTGSGSG